MKSRVLSLSDSPVSLGFEDGGLFPPPDIDQSLPEDISRGVDRRGARGTFVKKLVDEAELANMDEKFAAAEVKLKELNCNKYAPYNGSLWCCYITIQ